MIRNQELQAHADMEAVLSISGVHVQYGDKRVLQDINLSVSAGEFVGLIGQNGAGKTTLLRVILGLLAPTEGNVHIAGKPVGRGRSLVGYVPQKIHLDTDTPMRPSVDCLAESNNDCSSQFLCWQGRGFCSWMNRYRT